jgi:hypothetical protein
MRKTPLIYLFLLAFSYVVRAQSPGAYADYHTAVKKIFRHECNVSIGLCTDYTSINHRYAVTGVGPDLEYNLFGFTLQLGYILFYNTNSLLYSFNGGASYGQTPYQYSIEKLQMTLSRLLATFSIRKGIYQLYLGAGFAHYYAADVPLPRLNRLVDTTNAPIRIKTMGQNVAWSAFLNFNHPFWWRNQEFDIALAVYCPFLIKDELALGDMAGYYYYAHTHDLLQLRIVYNINPVFRCSPNKTRLLL